MASGKRDKSTNFRAKRACPESNARRLWSILPASTIGEIVKEEWGRGVRVRRANITSKSLSFIQVKNIKDTLCCVVDQQYPSIENHPLQIARQFG